MLKSQLKAVEAGKLVETVNALPSGEFFEQYCNSSTVATAIFEVNNLVGKNLDMIVGSAERLKTEHMGLLNACFRMIETSSADDYRASSIRWSPQSKRKEMVLPDMKYLILQDEDVSPEDNTIRSIVGFVSFMITYEDGHEVVYIYEIHLQSSFQGQGVGRVLVNMVEQIGRQVKVEKCMLTVFKANKRAVKWYDRMSYRLDDFSPGPRVLRNGTVKEPSYLILSKSLR